ncbi:uncharacterized protein LOC133308064 [Gastrolobium bilobum]|uniref:uncharacterized protein LOC133308064 n=1 Tax=Gastrolobium bilobum TaxID=150636 RepID=UPI002AAF4B14|nr:uncharacterized protein LOC133308064 [Gastrolobium bilobum]
MESNINESNSSIQSNVQVVDTEVENLNRPLWRYVTRVEDGTNAGGNMSWKCKFCQLEYRSSYTRVKTHLLKIKCKGIGVCKKVKRASLMEMGKLEEEYSERVKNNASRSVPLPPSNFSTTASTSAKRKISDEGTANMGPVERAFNMGEREELNHIIARMFYSAGLPFHLARNLYFQQAFTYATSHNISGYQPPGYNLLRTTLLTQEKDNIDRLCIPARSLWRSNGVSIVSDGWSDSQRRPIINFMAVCDGVAMFLKSVDCSGDTKDKYFIFNLLKEVIQEVGVKVVQVITDNAANYKGAGQLIEQEYPTISWTPCVVHTLNLALKNICAAKNVENNEITYGECSWISKIIGHVSTIKTFIMSHSMRLSMFNEFVPLKLLSIADTRFASMIVMLKRFKLIKAGLQNMVICEKWSIYKDDHQGRARLVKEKILDDEFWADIDYILAFTTPIYDMSRFCDTDKPCLHLVYDMWDAMIEKVKNVIYLKEGRMNGESSTFYYVVYKILVDRWTKSSTPLHCLAHALNPKYYSDQWLAEDPNRVSPDNDVEINLEVKKFFRRHFSSMEERATVNLEYVNFVQMKGDFREFEAIENRYTMNPNDWNKIDPKRAEDLVYIHSNLRLLSRKSPKYNEGESQYWDISGDAVDTFNDVGALDGAALSLDEPELEANIISSTPYPHTS